MYQKIMSLKAEQQTSSLDTVKLILAFVLLLVGIGGFYYFATWKGEAVSVLVRVLGLLAFVAVAVGIAATTEKGRGLITFLKDSRMEVRKMVWPTRAETMQTTLMVMVIVLLLSLFLWLVDMLLGWGVKTLLGGG
ncbi:preprotein translocase subunit SecE [uncultured Thiothrix sp.]|uniref:preprotein translocase subunit SecE n=1 Tax=uncultured Thiothrix sp. TaxID=223185 RepID=UPI0026130106|nr:preprotein translocase subunit SecE [uncultured Thiothrix sp.]